MPKGPTKFEATPSGLYAYSPIARFLESIRERKGMIVKPTKRVVSEPKRSESSKCFVQDDIMKARQGYTKRQFEKAELPQELVKAMCVPTTQSMRAVLRQNLITSCLISPKDVDRVYKIFRPDPAAIKGKTIQRPPPAICTDSIDIPKYILQTHCNVELCMDMMFICKLGFLTSIDRSVRYQGLLYNVKADGTGFVDAMQMISNIYNCAGFIIRTVHCDQQFESIADKVERKLNIYMNCVGTQDHVSEAEHNQHTTKERFLSVTHGLYFNQMPPVMIKKLAAQCTQGLNYVHPKMGCPPFTVLT
jgi:hypothetical protein